MIDDNIFLIQCAECVPAVSTSESGVFVAEAKTHEADNNIVGTDLERIIGYTDSVTGRGLAGNRNIAVSQVKSGIQMNCSGNFKNDGTFSGLIAGIAE